MVDEDSGLFKRAVFHKIQKLPNNSSERQAMAMEYQVLDPETTALIGVFKHAQKIKGEL